MLTLGACLLLLQAAPEEIERALQQDTAGKQTQGAPSAPAPAAPSAPVLPAPPAAQQVAQRPGATLLNPAISVILDGYFGYVVGPNPGGLPPPAGDDPTRPGPSAPISGEGFGLEEVEVAFQSAIDPYLEGSLFLTIPNLDGIEVEEGYFVTTSLPLNLQIKAGSFRSQMGRNNTQHLHLQNFTRRPLMTAVLFGPDGLRGPGLQASVLLPLPWFATFFVEALTVDTPSSAPGVSTFGGGDRGDASSLTSTFALEQSWDLGESTTAVLGLNFATGKAFVCSSSSCRSPRDYFYGADLYLKWKPPNVVKTYANLQWTTEYFARTITEGGGTTGAIYTEADLQFARRWLAGVRFDWIGLPEGTETTLGTGIERRYATAASLTFTPSEFSRFRGYAQEVWGSGAPNAVILFMQMEISMGAHGAHPF